MRRAVSAARREVPDHERHFLWLAGIAALHIWDDESWDAVSARHVELARAAGALAELPLALSSRAVMLTFAGELTAAAALLQELKTVTEATGDSLATDPAMNLVGISRRSGRGVGDDRSDHRDVMERGEGIWLSVAEFAEALLNNGIGDHRAALPPFSGPPNRPTSPVGLGLGRARRSRRAQWRNGHGSRHRRTTPGVTSASGTDWALGVEARSRALLSDGAEADRLYREAIERLGRTRMRTELARAHLLYGEWLRRERRRADARTQLRIAHDMLEAIGMEGFAERARRELRPPGRPPASAPPPHGPQLTPQEDQIARLAAEGLTNPEIGARLFLSAKTVQYHLSKVFTKLGISSRSQLPQALQSDPPAASR